MKITLVDWIVFGLMSTIGFVLSYFLTLRELAAFIAGMTITLLLYYASYIYHMYRE